MMTNNADAEIKVERVSCALCGQNEIEPVARGCDYEYMSTNKEFCFVRCSNCGHYYLNPRPTSEAAGKIYPPNYYTMEGRHSGGSKIIAYLKNFVIRRRLALFKKYFKRPITVLEIGCGDCALLVNIKRRYPQINCVGVDLRFSGNARSVCHELGISLLEGTIEEIDLPEDKFGLVIMNQLIEHLWQPVEVLKKINRSMTDDSMISIETVNVSGYDRMFFKKRFWGGYYFPRHLNLFDFGSLRRLLEMTGFKIIRQYSLSAPIVWAFSFHSLVSDFNNKKEGRFSRFFSDKNPICLGIFASIDIIALLCGLITSNQKAVGRKINYKIL